MHVLNDMFEAVSPSCEQTVLTSDILHYPKFILHLKSDQVSFGLNAFASRVLGQVNIREVRW